VPGIRSVTKYVPAEEVLAVVDTLVARLLTVTSASGTTAPLGSVTVPEIPLRPCPAEGKARIAASNKLQQSGTYQFRYLMDTPKVNKLEQAYPIEP
jgi:hypothetical protein